MFLVDLLVEGTSAVWRVLMAAKTVDGCAPPEGEEPPSGFADADVLDLYDGDEK